MAAVWSVLARPRRWLLHGWRPYLSVYVAHYSRRWGREHAPELELDRLGRCRAFPMLRGALHDASYGRLRQLVCTNTLASRRGSRFWAPS